MLHQSLKLMDYYSPSLILTILLSISTDELRLSTSKSRIGFLITEFIVKTTAVWLIARLRGGFLGRPHLLKSLGTRAKNILLSLIGRSAYGYLRKKEK